MDGMGGLYQSVCDIVDRSADGGLLTGDEVVLRSLLNQVTDDEVSRLLENFFDVEPLTLAIFEVFQVRGATWGLEVRAKLAESLTFCGLDIEAQRVIATLR
jgi:hypothetical protein